VGLRFLLVALIVALPSASAAFQPVLYYLKDGETGPVGDGMLTSAPPPPFDAQNPANNTPPSVRTVLPNPLPPVQFVMLNASDNTGWIYGPVFVMLYADDTPLMQKGNVTVDLVLFDPDEVPGIDEPTILASATQANDASNLTPPEPTQFVPPDPTDPQGALAYVQGKLLAYGLPMVLQFPLLFFLDDNVTDGIVNAQLETDARLALQISLEPGSSTLPVAQGAQPIKYDFALSPSLLYIPWFALEEIPPYQPPTQAPPPQAPPPTPPSDEEEDTEGSGSKGSPGLGFLAALLAVGLAGFARRRW
jgi:hypothetical protein